jgi:hypothetical protein
VQVAAWHGELTFALMTSEWIAPMPILAHEGRSIRCDSATVRENHSFAIFATSRNRRSCRRFTVLS